MNALYQWWVLSARTTAPTLRGGAVVTAMLAPAVFTLGFFVPLELVMSFYGHGLSSYAQFLMPMIVLQAMAFTAISAAFHAATDQVDGINRRFAAMPIVAWAPLAARMTATSVRCAVALAAAVVCGHVIGFRFVGGGAATAGFVVYAFGIGMALSLAGEVLGQYAKSPEATTQVLMLPQLILGMLSAGFAPVHQFPSWVQPFVANQPVTHFVYGLRALAGDSSGNAGPLSWVAVGWVVGLIVVCAPLAVSLNTRRP